MTKTKHPITHAQLVERAARWLANTRQCPIVITEMGTSFEIPDAIGWNTGGGSTLIECKTSKSDFKADQWKPGRRNPAHFGMCNHRYYLVPPDLIDYVIANLPEQWGALVAYKTRVEIRVRGDFIHTVNKSREISVLISALRRLAGEKEPIAGMNVKYYTIDNSKNPIATIGIEK